ncbi:MAG: cyclic nucleotide-binding domain-containing protein [Polyangiaceae bacterium]
MSSTPRPDPDILRRTAIFRSLDEADFTALLVCLRVRTASAGEVLFREGEPADSMMIVGEGTLTAVVRRKDGGEEEINRMGPGELIGEMAFLDPAPRSATVRAVTPASFYELDDDGLATLRRRAPTAAAALVWATLRDVTRRLRRMDRLIQHELSRRPGALLPEGPKSDRR